MYVVGVDGKWKQKDDKFKKALARLSDSLQVVRDIIIIYMKHSTRAG